MNKVYDIVNKLLEEYIGGEIFFDELDAAVKFNQEILWELFTTVKQKFPNHVTIASGEIALACHNLRMPIDFIVKGGLRHNPNDINLAPFNIEGLKFIFIDDSYFSGKTYKVVKKEIEKNGGVCDCAFVVYDGSEEKDENIHSLYRYYDYH